MRGDDERGSACVLQSAFLRARCQPAECTCARGLGLPLVDLEDYNRRMTPTYQDSGTALIRIRNSHFRSGGPTSYTCEPLEPAFPLGRSDGHRYTSKPVPYGRIFSPHIVFGHPKGVASHRARRFSPDRRRAGAVPPERSRAPRGDGPPVYCHESRAPGPRGTAEGHSSGPACKCSGTYRSPRTLSPSSPP
jgi:hypothetical protein